MQTVTENKTKMRNTQEKEDRPFVRDTGISYISEGKSDD
jgi:hypothetical protein